MLNIMQHNPFGACWKSSWVHSPFATFQNNISTAITINKGKKEEMKNKSPTELKRETVSMILTVFEFIDFHLQKLLY